MGYAVIYDMSVCSNELSNNFPKIDKYVQMENIYYASVQTLSLFLNGTVNTYPTSS